ncbi:MAG: hypothetical protein M1834_001201 [Cirrosporium novae-zelandiae]|nr:MAG: hypothetical protein M1834_001201 [Cirrosporium novae-zelandiae]
MAQPGAETHGMENYSTLEVRHSMGNAQKEAVNTDTPPPASVGVSQYEKVGNYEKEVVSQSPSQWKQKRIGRPWIIALIAAVAIVAVAVGVGVGVAVTRKQSQESTTASTNNPTATSANNSTAASSDSSTNAQSTATLSNTQLASIAWNDSSDVMQYRIYYQDESNNIRESAWNTTSNKWYVSNKSIGKAKTASPIAAAVTGPQGWDFQINIYWINESGNLVEYYTEDGTKWLSGTLTSQEIVPFSASGLSTVWHRQDGCVGCPNTLLLVYQDNTYKFNQGNFTGSGWEWSTLNANPIPGSGISLILRWGQDGVTTGLRLYYQIEAGNLCNLLWGDPAFDSIAAKNGNWQNREASDRSLQVIAFNVSIAAFTWGFTNTSQPILMGILSSGNHGVTDVWWTGVTDNWETQNPETMSSVDTHTHLATNAGRRAYALEDGVIEEYEVEEDGTQWFQIGQVA